MKPFPIPPEEGNVLGRASRDASLWRLGCGPCRSLPVSATDGEFLGNASLARAAPDRCSYGLSSVPEREFPGRFMAWALWLSGVAGQEFVVVSDCSLDELVDQAGFPGAGSSCGERVAGAEPGGGAGEHVSEPAGEVVLGAGGPGDRVDGGAGVISLAG